MGILVMRCARGVIDRLAMAELASRFGFFKIGMPEDPGSPASYYFNVRFD
jgi:hypothetical protein